MNEIANSVEWILDYAWLVYGEGVRDGNIGREDDEDSWKMASRADLAEALRVKEAQENALFAPQFDNSDSETGFENDFLYPSEVMTLTELRNIWKANSLELIIALHPFDKAEGKYTGEVITGQELAELLEGQ